MPYPTLTLRPGRERSVINRHPWVFSGAVERIDGAAPEDGSGEIIAIHKADGGLLGYGHLAEHSQIVCRMFAFTTEARTFEADYWLGQLRQALAYRRRYLNLSHTTGYRLINAEGDHLPGLVIDLYADAAVLQLRTPGMLKLKDLWAGFLQSELNMKHILEKGEGADEGKKVNTWLLGGLPEIEFRENGLRFIAELEAGQKTGFFLDQRDSRHQVGQLAQGRRVLNAFGYSGAFGVYALAHGASHVTSVDSSTAATALADRTLALNGFSPNRFANATADCFHYLKQMPEGEFDLIVLDPPAFTKHIRTVEQAARGYKEINRQAIARIAPGGLVFTYSCSQHISRELFRKIVFSAAADARRPVRLLAQTGHGPDHPVDLYHPEGEYLKGLVLVVE